LISIRTSSELPSDFSGRLEYFPRLPFAHRHPIGSCVANFGDQTWIENIMPQGQNTKAAERHEAAAKSHRSAADAHCANHHSGGLEHATKGHAESEEASKASADAHRMSAAAHKAM
jgi:hypothetical protein